jgi:hypothetical protein
MCKTEFGTELYVTEKEKLTKMQNELRMLTHNDEPDQDHAAARQDREELENAHVDVSEE